MVKNSKKAEKVPKEVIKTKPKSAKTQVQDESLSNVEIESAIVSDSQWRCTIFMFVFQTPNMFDSVLQKCNTFSNNFTIISKDAIFSSPTKKEQDKVKSPKSSKGKNALPNSKSSRKSDKTNPSGIGNIDTQVNGNEESLTKNNDYFSSCLSIKQSIIKLRNADISRNVIPKDIPKQYTKNYDKPLGNTSQKQIAHNDSSNNKRTSEQLNLINHRFIILIGFYNVLMINEMEKLFIPITAIIHFREGKTFSGANRVSIISTSSPTDVRRQKDVKDKNKSLDKKFLNEYMDFLDDINKISVDKKFLEKNKDLLFLNYISNNSVNINNEESKNKFIHNVMSLVLKVNNSWEKYEKYKNSIKLIHVPEVDGTLKLEDAKLYTTMISLVPLECVNTAVVLHCIVEQVTWWHNDHQSESEDQRSDRDECLATHSSIDQDQKPLSVTCTCTGLENITPIIIDNRDEVGQAVFHLNLPEFDFNHITTRMLTSSPIYMLWKIFSPKPLAKARWYKYHVNKLKSCTGYDPFNIPVIYNTFLHQSIINLMTVNFEDILESIDDEILTNTEENGLFHRLPDKDLMYDSTPHSFVRKIINNIINKFPAISPKIHHKDTTQLSDVNHPDIDWFVTQSIQNCPKKSSLQTKHAFLVSQLNKLKLFLIDSELANLYIYMLYLEKQEQKIDSMKNYELIEEMCSNTMCQSLQTAFQTFPNINYQYFPPTDSILLWFNYTAKGDIISSNLVEGIIETLLGFRDFYKYKLKAKITLDEIDLLNMENILAEHLNPKLSQTDCFKNNNASTDIQKCAYNICPSQLKVSEMCKYFCSTDSSCVTVKRTKLFNATSNVTVTVIKNNTSLKYEFDPHNPKQLQQIYIRLCDKIHMNCYLKINENPQKPYSVNRVNDYTPVNKPSQESLASTPSLKLDCNFSVTLESGLLVEVVQTDSDLGPFYIRQTYLDKGPTCSSIWEERSRCYYNNGTTIIFYEDDVVDILYSNGTMVKCKAFEAISPGILSVDKLDFENTEKCTTKNSKINQNKKNTAIDSIKTNKINKNKKTSMNNDFKQKFKDETYKESEKKHLEAKNDLGLTTDMQKYNIIENSVTSWKGELIEFKNGKLMNKEMVHNIKMAYDYINQEFYLNRSDGWNSLLLPTNLSVRFPNGSKTETYTDDFKEVDANDGPTSEECNIRKNSGEWQQAMTSLASFGPQVRQLYNGNLSMKSEAEDKFVLVETTHIMTNQNYATIKYTNSQCEAEVILPGNVQLRVDKDGMFNIDINGTERLKLSHNQLSFEANVLSHTYQKSFTTLNFEKVNSSLSVSCGTIDSFGNECYVSNMGKTSIGLSKKGITKTSHPCFPHNIERFFVLNRDLTGYEMIHENQHKYFLQSLKNDLNLIKIPLIENFCDLVSLYIQTPIYKNKSEEYLVDSTTNKILPTLIKRKDLLDITNRLGTIWFIPRISTISQTQINKDNQSQLLEAPKAITTTKILRIREINVDVSILFFDSLRKYIQTGKEIYEKYFNFYHKELGKEEIHELGKSFTQKILGSKSYYLLDNLPLNTKD